MSAGIRHSVQKYEVMPVLRHNKAAQGFIFQHSPDWYAASLENYIDKPKPQTS